MIPILFSSISEGTVPTSFGIGHLTDIISSKVIEKRNAEYELSFTYAANGIHAEEILVDRFVLAKPNYTDDPQLFQIYEVTGTLNGRFEVKAEHVSYALSGKIITSGTAASCSAACLLLQGSAGNFTITTDKTVVADFKILEPSSVKSWFGGKQGSLLDVYGTGEWHYDNFTATLKLHRGQDRGVTLRYGLNLTELSQIINISNLATAVQGYYKDPDTGVVTLGTKISTGLTLNLAKERAIDFSGDVDPESATPIATQLDNLTNNYIANNQLDTAFKTITLDFVQEGGLSDRVDLCDTVHIYFEALGISAALKCIETEWDVINERYTKCTFGNSRVDITDSIQTIQKEVAEKPSTSMMEEAIKYMTDLITGNIKGYVINGHDTNGDGYPDENLIMDTNDITTATKVIRSNLGGIGFSTNGYDGPYTTCIGFAGIIADAITTGTLNANLIKAGVISDINGNSTIDMTSGVATLKNMKAKERFELVDENGVTRGFFKYEPLLGEPHLAVIDADTDIHAEMYGNANGGNFGINNPSGVRRGLLGVGSSGTGILYLYDNNSEIRATLLGTGWLELRGGGINIYNDNDERRVYTFITNDRGYLYLRDENNISRVQLYGDGGVVVCDANGDTAIDIDGSSGQVKPKGTQQVELYSGSLTNGMIFKEWGYNNYIIVGRVTNSGSLHTLYIPKAMITDTNQQFCFADESNWVTFSVKWELNADNEKELVLTFGGRSSSGLITAVYGSYT
jgi:phage minor structural protein